VRFPDAKLEVHRQQTCRISLLSSGLLATL
jgi:hypothetical protein